MISFNPQTSFAHDTVHVRDLVPINTSSNGLRHISESARITREPHWRGHIGQIGSKGPAVQDKTSLVVCIGAYVQPGPDEEVFWGVYFGRRSWYNQHGTGSDDFKVVAHRPELEFLARQRKALAILGGELEALKVALQTIDVNRIVDKHKVRTIFIKCASTYLQMKLTEDAVHHELWFPELEPRKLTCIRYMMENMVVARDGGLVFKFWSVSQPFFRNETVCSAQPLDFRTYNRTKRKNEKK